MNRVVVRFARKDALEKSAVLEVREITRLYKSSRRNVSGVSFVVEPGEFFGLMVPNSSVWGRF